MNTLRKLALAGIGLAFVIGLAVTESNAQRYGRSYGNRTYSRSYGYEQPRYASYGNRRYNRYYNNGYGSGNSWRARRILAIRRAKMIRAQNRYYRTRNRIYNRYNGNNRNVYYYRNY